MAVKMTAEYVAGTGGGIGIGLAISSLAMRWLEPGQLSMAGAVMACSSLLAYWAQKATDKSV